MLSNNGSHNGHANGIVFDPAQHVWFPSESQEAMRAYLEQVYKDKRGGIKSGFSSVDTYSPPMLPGEVTTILARPSAGKSTMLVDLARKHARMGGVPVLIQEEQPREAIVLKLLAAETGIPTRVIRDGALNEGTFHALLDGLEDVRKTGVILIGYSMGSGSRITTLSATMVMDCLDYIKRVTGGLIKPSWLGWDYLQATPPSVASREGKVVDIINIMKEIRDVAKYGGAPCHLAVQADREADKTAPYIPRKEHCQWGSVIEQGSDAIWSLMYPIQHWVAGETFNAEGKTNKDAKKLYKCTPNMLFLTVLKNRESQPNKTILLDVDMAANRMGDVVEGKDE